MSKFSLDVLKRCVYPYTKCNDPDVLMGSHFGEDVALTKVGSHVLASHVDPIVGAVENIGKLAVHIACNDIATSGIPPRWILLLVLVPSPEYENSIERIMRDAHAAAEKLNISIIGGHTGYSSNVSRPLVAVTALGNTSDFVPIRTSGAQVNDHVLITKGIALEGTAILAYDFSDVAEKFGIKQEEREEARLLIDEVSVVPEAVVLARQGATSMHDVTRGGLLETLMEIAHLSEVGIEVDMSQIPMRSIVSRFAQAFKFDPLRMISSGTLVATIPSERVEEAARTLRKKRIKFGLIGKVLKGSGVRIIQDKEISHYTEIKSEEDELARMWDEYPRNEFLRDKI
jgi:hydrogenase expression/formation protein HypE